MTRLERIVEKGVVPIVCGTTFVLALAACRSRANETSLRDASSQDAGAPAVDVVSNASLVDDELDADVSYDSGTHDAGALVVDGAKLRERHRERIAKDTSAVVVERGETPFGLGRTLCEAVVPKRPPETPVLVKPNLGGFEWFRDPKASGGDDGVRGRTTDPEFVRGIVRCLKARGHTRVTIAEGWGATHADWQKLIQVSGYEAMAKEEGVRLVAMDDDGVFDVKDDRPGLPLSVSGLEKSNVPTLLASKILAEHLERGLFITAPKIKAHRFGVTSMAIKGMQGTVMLSDARPTFRQKWRMHRELGAALDLLKRDPEAGRRAYLESLEVFAERIVDVLEVFTPDVVLAEGAPAMGGDGFAKRWPMPELFAIGGTNPVLVDRVGAEALGLWNNADLARELGGHATSPLIEVAAKRLGVDVTQPKLSGSGAEWLRGREKKPVHFVSMSGFQIHSGDAPSTKAPVIEGAHFDVAPRVDGVVDDVWKRAKPVTFSKNWAGYEMHVPTTVRIGWTKEALYVLWELENASLRSDETKPIGVERAKLYEEDCVEIFLAPNAADRQKYFEVEVGPLGHFLDLRVDRASKKSDVDWSSRPEIRTHVDRDGRRATIEVALRAPEIVNALRVGAELPLALYRMDGIAPRRYLAWSPTHTPKPNFHVPEAFGVLKL